MLVDLKKWIIYCHGGGFKYIVLTGSGHNFMKLLLGLFQINRGYNIFRLLLLVLSFYDNSHNIFEDKKNTNRK